MLLRESMLKSLSIQASRLLFVKPARYIVNFLFKII